MNQCSPGTAEYSGAMIADLIRTYRHGGPLPRAFYCHPEVFAADMDRIWRRYWLYVGHGCMLPKVGDWLTWQVGTDSVVVVRTKSGEIKAFHNTCRHRGARFCNAEKGNGQAFSCPYHGWTYDLDGRLTTRTMKDFGVAESELGLHPVKLRDVGGLLFIALGDDPVDFDQAHADIAGRMKHQGMNDAKVAKAASYTVKANWKLVFENNRECYHCRGSHPELCRTWSDNAVLNGARTLDAGANNMAHWARCEAAGLASRCEAQVAYAIGKAHPVGLYLETFGTETVDPARIATAVREVFDLRPAAIIRDLDLLRPIYKQTAAYGHFGRTDPGLDLPWERTDRVEALRTAVS